MAEAARRVAGKPPPEPERRSRLPALVVLIAVAALVRAMHREQQRGTATA